MEKRRPRRLLITVLAVAGSLLLMALTASTAIRSRSFQNWVLERLMKRLEVRLSMDIRRVTMGAKGLEISGRSFSVDLPAGRTRITAPRITLGLDAGALLRGKLYPRRLILYNPRIVVADAGGGRAAMGWTVTSVTRSLNRLQVIHLQGGEVVFQNRPWKISDLTADLSRSAENPKHLKLRVAAVAGHQNQSASFTLAGSISGNERSPGALAGSVTLSTWKVPLTWVPANRYLSFTGGLANVGLKVSLAGNGALSLNGRIWSKALDFRLTAGAAGMPYRLVAPGLDFQLKVADGVWNLSSFRLETHDYALSGQSRLDMRTLPEPYLALKVRAACMPLQVLKSIIPYPVLPPWFKTELMPLFTRGQVCIDTFGLNGHLDRIRRLDRRENADVMTIRLGLKKIRAFEKTAAIPLEAASGELVVSGGRLAVTGIKGKLATSTIDEASFHIADLYAERTTATAAVTGNFTLTDISKLVVSPGTTPDSDAQERIRPLAGRAHGRLKLHFNNLRQPPEIESADAAVYASRIMIREQYFDVDRASVQLSPEGLLEFSGTARWKKTSSFSFSGHDRMDDHQGRVVLDARADVARVLEQLIPKLPLKFRQPAMGDCRLDIGWGSAGATFTGQLDLAGMKVSWAEHARADFPANSRLDFSIGAPTSGGVVFQRLDLTAGPTSLAVSGDYDPDRWPAFFADVASDYFSPQDISLNVPSPASPSCGVFSGRLQIETNADDIESLRIYGRLSGEDIRPRPRKDNAPAVKIDFKTTFSGRRVQLQPLKITTDSQVVLISGDLDRWQRPTGTLHVSAGTVDLEELATLREGKTGSLTRWLKTADLKIDIDAPVLQFKKFCAGPFNAQCRLRYGVLEINQASITHPLAMITGDGYLALGDGPTPRMSLSAQVEVTKYPLETLLRQAGLSTSRFSGNISLLGHFNTSGYSGRDLVANLNGTFNLWIEQGIITRSTIILKIMDRLSLKDMFDRRPAEAAGDGFYYEDIQNRSLIKNGTLALKYFKLNSPAFNALATGSIILTTGAMDIDLGIQPLGTIDTLVSHVPVIGHILAGRDKSVLVYYFKVNGKVSAPEVHYVPFKNLGKNMLGYFKRTFLTPGRLWNKLSDFTRDYNRRHPPDSRRRLEKDPDTHHDIR